MDSILSGPINIENLLLSKSLEPISAENVKVLQRIQDYREVEKFNEAEVRSFVIDPILKVLGYDKGTPFSPSLENHLTFLGQKRRSDYQIHFWEENFWLLEAKRPQVGLASFTYEDFSQALEYSVHPSVNAALIVLCDGLKLEIFDREVNVDCPILRVEIRNLVAEFTLVPNSNSRRRYFWTPSRYPRERNRHLQYSNWRLGDAYDPSREPLVDTFRYPWGISEGGKGSSDTPIGSSGIGMTHLQIPQ